MTVQGPVKKQRPDGMSHGGGAQTDTVRAPRAFQALSHGTKCPGAALYWRGRPSLGDGGCEGVGPDAVAL